MQDRSTRFRHAVFALAGIGYFTAAVTAAVAAGEVAVLYHDDFSYATGGRQIQADGKDPVVEGEVHCSMYSYGRPHWPVAGRLKLIMAEDNSERGPDGNPGVLRMEFADIPLATDYTGFVITGNEKNGGITIPDWAGDARTDDLSKADLGRVFISFRFRGENRRNPRSFNVLLKFRFDPGQEDGGEFGADFGTLIATRNWRTLKRPIGSAKNLDAFLANLNRTKPQRFKLVWSQAGPIGVYQPGDALLIDDLKITVE